MTNLPNLITYVSFTLVIYMSLRISIRRSHRKKLRRIPLTTGTTTPAYLPKQPVPEKKPHNPAFDPPPSKYMNVDDRAPLLRTLAKAGALFAGDTILTELPTWSEVEEQYGPRPVIRGQDTCRAFRDRHAENNNNNDKSNPAFITIAGLPGTGIKHVEKLLRQNCNVPVVDNPWWKHAKPSESHAPEHIIYPNYFRKEVDEKLGRDVSAMEGGIEGVEEDYAQNILQVVMVLDPFHWIDRMCRNRFSNSWNCLNQQPDMKILDEEFDAESAEVFLSKPQPQPNDDGDNSNNSESAYESLVDLWNRWNGDHSSVISTSSSSHSFSSSTPPEPRSQLMIRFEDLIFHPQDVLADICECAGGEMSPEFVYGGSAGSIKNRFLPRAMILFGRDVSRIERFSDDDLFRVKKKINRELMDLFGYAFPNTPSP